MKVRIFKSILIITFLALGGFFFFAFQAPENPISSPIKEQPLPNDLDSLISWTEAALDDFNYILAEKVLEKTIKKLEKTNPIDQFTLAQAYTKKGDLLAIYSQFDYWPAIEAYQEAAKLFASVDTAEWSAAQCNAQLGLRLAMQRTDLVNASERLEQALSSKISPQVFQIDALYGLGLVAIAQNDSKALAKHLEPLQAIQRRFATYKPSLSLLLKAELALMQKQWPNAYRLLAEAEKQLQNSSPNSQERLHLARLHNKVAKSYEGEDNFKMAAEYCQRSLQLISVGFEAPDNLVPNPSIDQIVDLPIALEALLIKAHCLQNLDSAGSSAMLSAQLAAALAGSLQNQVYCIEKNKEWWSICHRAYELAIETYFDKVNPESTELQELEELFYLMERHRLLWLWSIMNPKENIYQEQHWAWWGWRFRQMALGTDSLTASKLKAQAALAEEKHQTVLSKMQAEVPRYLALKYAPNLPKLADVQAALNVKGQLNLFFEGEYYLYILTVSKKGGRIDRQSMELIPQKISKFKELLKDKHAQEDNFASSAYELYKLILPTAIEPDVDHCVMIPDGQLVGLSFGLLVDSLTTHNSFKEQAYLLKKYNFSYQYSTNLWWEQLQKRQNPSSYRLLVFSPNADSINGSKEAAKELAYLEERFSPSIYKGEQATAYRLKAQAPFHGFLHIGAVVQLDNILVDNSALLCSKDTMPGEDDRLNLKEIQALKLNTALVVLSNCMGSDSSAIALEAVGASFGYAGALSLLQNNWNNAEEKQALLWLKTFYEHLQQGFRKDDALRQAQLATLAKAKEGEEAPYYWASIIQIGDNRAISISEPIGYIWWYLLPLIALIVLGWWSLRALRQRRKF